jgi:hypothetical protein
MVSPFTLTLPTGRASFESVIRCWDESPQDGFSVELVGQRTLYGIWKPTWAPNENDFNVEIIKFGWADKYNTGNPNPITRTRLSAEQAAGVKWLVLALFHNAEVRNRITPFARNPELFLGRIDFNTDWIWLKAGL